ncbi:hypothetical protein SDC9_94269 [bioreactor metagenome]|uniref:DhaL domain-containing protein n=1 Tax=bioreactor metagenome TaxID=1076179 RepID=A0A645A4C7_9ZZZZ
MLFQLGLEALKQGEGVGRCSGESPQHSAVIELAHLARRALDHDVAKRDLAVAANGDLNAAVGQLATDAENGGAVILFHGCGR